MSAPGNIIRECLGQNLSPEEYIALKLVEINSTGERHFASSFIAKHGQPEDAVITRLVERKLIQAPFKTAPPWSYTDVISLTISRAVMMDLAEEMWHMYPATINLSNGGTFIARTGGNKDILLLRYLDKIKWDESKHQFVIAQLKRYMDMVKAGKINGHKISQWIEDEMWDTIASIDVSKDNAFREEI